MSSLELFYGQHVLILLFSHNGESFTAVKRSLDNVTNTNTRCCEKEREREIKRKKERDREREREREKKRER